MIRILSNSSPQAKAFLAHMREDLQNHNVKLIFSRTRMVRFAHGVYTAGYFKEPSPRKAGCIRVGTGNRKPITILANLTHEYAHFLQWKNNDKAWTRSNEDFIEGSSYIELEQRTERQTISLLREWEIPANYNAIRMRSRSYITFLRNTEIDT